MGAVVSLNTLGGVPGGVVLTLMGVVVSLNTLWGVTSGVMLTLNGCRGTT